MIMNDRAFKGLGDYAPVDDYVVLDLETTGLDPGKDSIIEMGAIKVSNGVQGEKYSQLVNPNISISSFITRLTGIDDQLVAQAPSIERALPQFLDFVSDSHVIGHNVNFDINFVYDKSMKMLHKPFTNNYSDTMMISRRMFPQEQHHRLVTL